MVCVNKFPSDTRAEEQLVAECKVFTNVIDCVVSDHWARGGEGALDFAQSALAHLDSSNAADSSQLAPMQLYPSEWSLSDKISHVARKIHRASYVTFSKEAAAGLSTA